MDETFETIFEERFDELPEEMKDFIVGDEFTASMDAINTMIESPAQQAAFHKTLLLFLVGERTAEDLGETIAELDISDDKKNAIVMLVQDRIVEELIAIIEAHEELEGTPEAPAANTAPNPSQVLDALKQRLTEVKTVAPIARQTGTGITHIDEKEVPSAPSRIDPYRELPR